MIGAQDLNNAVSMKLSLGRLRRTHKQDGLKIERLEEALTRIRRYMSNEEYNDYLKRIK